MSISLDKSIVSDLINFKLRFITNEIELILVRWNESSIDDFLDKARDGTLKEAENDAIELKQLLIEEKKLRSILQNN
jgi:hypothetical protein